MRHETERAKRDYCKSENMAEKIFLEKLLDIGCEKDLFRCLSTNSCSMNLIEIENTLLKQQNH